MGLSEPMLIAAGIAGVIFMFFVFNAMRPLEGVPRMLAISAMVAIIVLLSNRLFANRSDSNSAANSFWDWLPGSTTDPGSVQPGWQNLPVDILGILLEALNSAQTTPTLPPTAPTPASPIPPLPTPALPTPTLPTPTPSLTVPAPSVPTPSVPPSAVQPSIQPAPTQPYDPYAPYGEPIPNPALPSPTPVRPVQPIQPTRPVQPARPGQPVQPIQPTEPPVSAWW